MRAAQTSKPDGMDLAAWDSRDPDTDLDPDSSTWMSSSKKAPELPTLRSQQHTIGKPVTRPLNLDTASPIDRPKPEIPKTHQDLSTTDNTDNT